MGRWMTIAQKGGIIMKAKECPIIAQEELAAWAKSIYKLKRVPAQTTISDILRMASTIMSAAYGDGKRRKPVKVTSPTLDTRLLEWILQVEAQTVCLSRELIRTKALELQKELCDAWDLLFSDGWFTAFERRHGLRSRQRHGEAAPADPAVVEAGRQKLQELSDLYEPHNIYNMDESGLCYATAPTRSICTRGTRGVKKTKTRITVASTANADGSDALPILFLGQAKQPCCFAKKKAEQLGFQYRWNQKAWMTGVIFREWLLNFHREMRADGRHVLLLLDNASSHNLDHVVCTNIRVEFLPPNTTAFLQPMDAGIIATFKRAYRRRQLLWVYDKIKRGEKLKKKPVYAIDQLQAMRWSEEIWREIQATRTIGTVSDTLELFSTG